MCATGLTLANACVPDARSRASNRSMPRVKIPHAMATASGSGSTTECAGTTVTRPASANATYQASASA